MTLPAKSAPLLKRIAAADYRTHLRYHRVAMVSPRLLTALYAAACHAQVPNPVDPAALTPLYEQVLQEREQLYGESSTQVAQAALDLGLQLKVTGDLSGAERMLRRALDISNSPESAEGLAG